MKSKTHMDEIKRERATETEVRNLDADDIVKWIHRLEDENEWLEEENKELKERISKHLDFLEKF